MEEVVLQLGRRHVRKRKITVSILDRSEGVGEKNFGRWKGHREVSVGFNRSGKHGANRESGNKLK